MLFGIPWFAIIPIVAIVGGLILGYRKQELEFEAKTSTNSKEVQELRKIIHNLKNRIENLEAIAAEDRTAKRERPLGDIEIQDDNNADDNRGKQRPVRN